MSVHTCGFRGASFNLSQDCLACCEERDHANAALRDEVKPYTREEMRDAEDLFGELAARLLATARAGLEAREQAITLRRAVAFFASCIKSGESWSPACDTILSATRSGRSAPDSP